MEDWLIRVSEQGPRNCILISSLGSYTRGSFESLISGCQEQFLSFAGTWAKVWQSLIGATVPSRGQPWPVTTSDLGFTAPPSSYPALTIDRGPADRSIGRTLFKYTGPPPGNVVCARLCEGQAWAKRREVSWLSTQQSAGSPHRSHTHLLLWPTPGRTFGPWTAWGRILPGIWDWGRSWCQVRVPVNIC